VTATVHDSRRDADGFAWLGARLRTTPRRAELIVGALLAVAAVGLTVVVAPDQWFGGDEMEFLTHRTAFDLGDLTKPFGGHWTTWSVLLLRGLYNVFGVDFWPWYYLPRLIGHTLLVVAVWRVIRHRGADPLVGLVAYAVLLVLGASGYQRALQVGNWAVYAALIVAAVVISRRPAEPTSGDRILVGAALFIGVLGNGYSVAVIGGLTLALLLARRLLVWIPSLLPAIAAYGLWYLSYRDDIRPKPSITLGKLIGIPRGGFRVVQTALESATGLPAILAALLTAGMVAWVLVLALRRRLDLFDSIILCTLGTALALLTVQRVALDGDAASRSRYGYSVTVLLVLALVPHIRLPPTLVARLAAVGVGAVMVAVNLNQMQDAIELRAANGRISRPLYEAAAELMIEGETVVDGPSVITPGLETDELQQLIDDGYDPGPLDPDDPDRDRIMEAARGALRILVADRAAPLAGYRPPAGVAPATEAVVDAEGCLAVAEDHPATATVTEAGGLTVRLLADQALVLTWEDGFGTGTRRVDGSEIERAAIGLAEPEQPATLTLTSERGDLRVCGFTQ
jgi:hypothetical protein